MILGQTDGCSWAAAQLPRPYPHLWQGEGSACPAFLVQTGLRHLWLPAVTPVRAIAQGTWALCSSRRREEQWGRAGSQAGGEMLGDYHSSREEIRTKYILGSLPSRAGPSLPSTIISRRGFPAPPNMLPCSLPFTAPEHRPLEMNPHPTWAGRGRLCQIRNHLPA